ncbi:MAG: CPBP family intramembrane metalloprotease [Oscillospiraceae bacterium]|nr:CPBP family intramembrane metalloprotease [Oscillospiraceae bacterium]
MEMTYERWRRKELRRRFSAVGWMLLIYYGIMNVSVFFAVFVESIIRMMGKLSAGSMDEIINVTMEAAESAWGYFLAVAVGLIILLCWKKPRFWKEEIWERGRPMHPGSFFGILCLFLSCQAVYQTVTMLSELILNLLGFSILEGMEAMAVDSSNFSMFLYTGILAPISEEILFRGLIQKSLKPYGKRFSILCSAFTFGIFHGNLLQSPYAFLVGLVLGYVAAEYSIGWAMVLHMINNLVIADMLNRLTKGLPETAAALVIWAVIAFFTICAIVVVIAKRKKIAAWLRRERINGLYVKCFFSNAGMIVLMILMGLSMILTAFLTIAPMPY